MSSATPPELCSYLLVLEGGTSRIVRLPGAGEVTIGVDPACDVQLADPSVAPRHAWLALDDGAPVVGPAAPEREVRVNGTAVAGPTPLASGDTLTFGAATLVFHREAVELRSSAMLDRDELRRALSGELERCRRYGHPASVILLEVDPRAPDGDRRAAGAAATRGRVAAAAAAGLRRLDSVGWIDDGALLVVLPATGDAAVPAGRLLSALARLAPGIRAGLASCPADGTDLDALLAAARRAARAAPAGGAATAGEAAALVTVGARRVVAADPAMAAIFALLARLARSDAPVLVTGETGVGKEVAAAALHEWSPRRDRPLVSINCAAIPETLLESELFGHERGAFTGAAAAKAGRLEGAAGGTVLLDEVGDLPAGAQAKLLRVLETKRVGRLGAVAEREFDVRIVAATNRSLADEVAAGRFRQDLYFRLAAATVVLPPLRDRPGDLPPLARLLLAEACARLGRPPLAIAPGALVELQRRPWPGNVRELRNVLEIAAATVPGAVLEAAHLMTLPAPAPAPRAPAAPTAGGPAATGAGPAAAEFRNIYDEIAELERTRMAAALVVAGGVRVRAAALIGMPLRTFVTKLRRYGLAEGADRRPRARA